MTKEETPLHATYHPDLDISSKLQATEAAYYMSLISMLIWIFELGHVEICFKYSMMSSQLDIPRA